MNITFNSLYNFIQLDKSYKINKRTLISFLENFKSSKFMNFLKESISISKTIKYTRIFSICIRYIISFNVGFFSLLIIITNYRSINKMEIIVVFFIIGNL